MNISANWTTTPAGHGHDPIGGGFNASNLAPWLVSRMRIFFYLSDPREETFQHVDQVPDYHAETMPLLVTFVLLEWLVMWMKGKPLPLLGDATGSAAMAVFMESFRIFTRGMEHSAYRYIFQNYRIVDLPWDSPYTWYLSAIFFDFCYYWGHRLSHEINIFWAHHQAHHSAEIYSLVNVFRLPVMNDWLYSFCYLPIAVVVPPSHHLVHLQLNLLYQFWLHTGVIGKLGPLEWIFNTPTHHKVHHGSNKYCLDKNYGAWLIIWDRMFGTFQDELPGEEIVFGLVDQVQSFNPLYLNIFYVGKIHDKWNAMDGWKNKLFSLIKGPGWRPGSPWTGYIDEVPDVRGRTMYTGVGMSRWQNAYALTHFFIMLFAFEAVSLFRERLGPTAVVCNLIFILFSMTATGMMFDGHPMAPFLEFARCSFFFLYSLKGLPLLTNALTWSGLVAYFGPTLVPQALFVLRAYFLVSSIAWGSITTYHAVERTTRGKERLGLRVKSQ